MEQSTFKFRVKQIEVGTCDVVMTINDKVIPYSASYIGIEPLKSMIEICAEIMMELDVDGKYRTGWADEPGGLDFTFLPKGEGVLHIDIVDENTKEEWHEDVPFEAFVAAIITDSFRVLNAFGLYGYRSAWASETEFPLSQLMMISGLYDKGAAGRFGFTSNLKDEAEFLSIKEKNDYVKQLLANLSSEELVLFFYYCLSSLGRREAKELVEKYALFRDFGHNTVFSPGHLDCFESGAYNVEKS